ncbi:histidine kinase [Spirosoma sp. HMF3257]|uniref:Histidine kinase n=1 Tax=Spirosoma telluris TaxID=2183553 RepID=A0A327NG93_9BACT|nr:histidine kinase [Spirosoma telluris]RAI73289.1 histidine kinase [Spirosoma telluris]
MSVSRDVRDQVEDLKERFPDLSNFEALQIATKIIKIEAYKEANVTDRKGAPSALEAIAQCLGKGGQFSLTITDAVNDVAQALNNMATAIEKK